MFLKLHNMLINYLEFLINTAMYLENLTRKRLQNLGKSMSSVYCFLQSTKPKGKSSPTNLERSTKAVRKWRLDSAYLLSRINKLPLDM